MPKDLTSESFAKLLRALSADEAEAAQLYTKLHESLVRYFEIKGIAESGKAADLVIDRIPERLNQDTKSEEVTYIAFGVAKFVFLEMFRKEKKQIKTADGFYPSADAGRRFPETDEFEPLRECFKSLYERERELLTKYFTDLSADRLSENRQKLAEREGIALNALRNRVSRLRKRLEDCLKSKK